MSTVLELCNVTKLYSNARGIRNISFSVKSGEILGLLGPNGSGKTTSMKAITGLCDFDSGSIEIFGFDVTEQFENALKDVGCLIEQPALYEYLSAYDNMRLAARYYPAITNADVHHFLELVDLGKYKNDKAAKFSLGMKQRLGLALALVSKPKLVILDEPANGLDIEGMVFVREVIIKMSQTYGTSFLVSSHLASELEKMCTRVAIIYDSELLTNTPMEQVLESAASLEEFFLSTIKQRRGEIIV